MNNFITALDKSLKTENWYASLFILLTLPDICGKIDEPNTKSSIRAVNWYNKYMKPFYTMKIGPQQVEHVFLSGADFYALRCAYLHEGKDDTSHHNIREALQKFQFTQPNSKSFSAHLMQSGSTLQIQVDKFGDDMLKALNKWMQDVREDHTKMENIESLLNIQMLDVSKGFSF